MKFEWDEQKNRENLRHRGFDFAFAAEIFEGPTIQKVDHRKAYGEVRVIAIGATRSIELTVVFTDRSEDTGIIRRIISARRSNRREREAYGRLTGDG